MLLVALALLGLAALTLGPHWWVQRTIRRHQDERRDFPGTGGELARHLLDLAGLGHVRVVVTEGGDHYDPETGTVALAAANHDGRSVTAVAIAAHEVGHALQHAQGDPAFAAWLAGARALRRGERLLSVAAFGLFVVGTVTFAPAVLVASFATGVLLVLAQVLLRLASLPVEFDASFGRALPILAAGGYLGAADLPAARSVLQAAAFTYVAAALVSLLDLSRFLRR